VAGDRLGFEVLGVVREHLRPRADAPGSPGDEGPFYLLNPGEAFAETYRLMNVQRAEKSNPSWYHSWGEPLPWQWQSFSHTGATIDALQKDVEHPWGGQRTFR
jgi:hypothetical protein